MKAYFIQSESKGTRLELREAPKPQPGPGQVLVRVRAASLNRAEFLVAHGFAKPGAARPAGNDGAGEVEGSGERVMGRLPGAFAEYALMDRHDLIPVPAALSWEEAAAVPIVFLVVHDMLAGPGGPQDRLRAGEWLLVTGVSSGVGVAALQAAKALGARVIGTSGSAEKLKRLESLGLDLGIETRKPDFHDAVMQATGGKGAALAVNTVGGTLFAECVRSLGLFGRLAVVGYVDGSMRSEIDLDAVHAKRLTIFGVSNKHRSGEQRAQTVQGFVRDFLPLFASGKLKPLIDRVYDFEDLPAAKARMEADAQAGKIVVRMR